MKHKIILQHICYIITASNEKVNLFLAFYNELRYVVWRDGVVVKFHSVVASPPSVIDLKEVT